MPPQSPRAPSTLQLPLSVQPPAAPQAVFLPLRQATDGSWPGYERIRGRVLRAPILRAFGDVRAPDEIRAWVDDVTGGDWDYDRIVSAHFSAPIGQTSPAEFRAAFGRLYGKEQARRDPTDWIPPDLIGSHRLPPDPTGSHWVPMGPTGSQWVRLDPT